MKEKLWNKNFIIACTAYFLLGCSFNLLMPTLPLYLSDELGVAASKIGIVLASYGLALIVIRPFSGYIVDVYARKPLLLFGMIAFAIVFIGYYFVVTVFVFVILRFVHGLFWGMSTVSSNTVAIDIIPSSRRAEGIGFFGVNMNLAMAIAPYIAVRIYSAHDFNTLVSSSLVAGILSVIAAMLIKVPARQRPEKIPAVSFDRFILIKAIPILLNQLLLAFGWGTLVAFAVLYGKEINLDNPGIFFLFLAAGTVLSRVNSGKLVDKGYMHQVIAVAIIIIAMGYTGFALFHNIFSYSASAFFIGLGYGILFPALQTLYVNMAPATQRGTANSTYLTGFDVGIAIGLLIGGYFAEHWGFSVTYLISGAVSFIALFIYWLNSRKVYEKYKVVAN